jgi:hypothetical protein
VPVEKAAASLMACPDRSAQALSDAEIDAIAALLKQGQFLDDQYRSRLFRPAKEYELSLVVQQVRAAILVD